MIVKADRGLLETRVSGGPNASGSVEAACARRRQAGDRQPTAALTKS